jgi:hypothetical protein
MTDNGLLSDYNDSEAPVFSFTKADQDQDSKRNPLQSVTVQGVTADGKPFSKARLPLNDQDQVVISEGSFGDDSERAWLVANLLEAEGWEYVEG